MGTSSPAKRRQLRPPLRIECARTGTQKPYFLGYAANLSETGVFVQSLATRPAGTRLRLLLYVPSAPGGVIASDAEVRWVRRYAGKRSPSAGMGMRFFGLRAPDRTVLQNLCNAPQPASAAVITRLPKTDRRTDG
jgi:hypothetical protein